MTTICHGYHAEARDVRGQGLPDRIWGWELPVLGDFDTLDAAREWAAQIFSTDGRVTSVVIVAIVAAPYDVWRRDVADHGEKIERGDIPCPAP